MQRVDVQAKVFFYFLRLAVPPISMLMFVVSEFVVDDVDFDPSLNAARQLANDYMATKALASDILHVVEMNVGHVSAFNLVHVLPNLRVDALTFD